MWATLGGSRRGGSHLECEDSWAVSTAPGGRHILVVADGCGSASHGGAGARLVTEAVLNAAELSDASMSLLEVVAACFRAASIAVGTDSSLASTCSVVVIEDDRVAGAAIGDSPIGVRINGHWVVWMQQSASEFVNETVFVTSYGALPEFWESAVSVDAVVLGSDGVIPFAFQNHVWHSRFCDPLVSRVLNSDLDMNEFLGFVETHHGVLGDDVTLIIGAHL